MEKLIKKFPRFIVIELPPKRPNLYRKKLNGFKVIKMTVKIKRKTANFTSVFLKKYLSPKKENIKVAIPVKE